MKSKKIKLPHTLVLIYLMVVMIVIKMRTLLLSFA